MLVDEILFLVFGLLSGIVTISNTITYYIIMKKIKKKFTKKMDDLGYDVNKNYINRLFDDVDITFLKVFHFIPGLNLYQLLEDIGFLLGNYVNKGYYTKFFEGKNFNENIDKTVDWLKEVNIIEENPEKMRYIKQINENKKMLETGNIYDLKEKYDMMDEKEEEINMLKEQIRKLESENNKLKEKTNEKKYTLKMFQ